MKLHDTSEGSGQRAEAALEDALDVMQQGHAAVEHLRDCDLAGTHDADADVVLAFLEAHDELARKHGRLPS